MVVCSAKSESGEKIRWKRGEGSPPVLPSLFFLPHLFAPSPNLNAWNRLSNLWILTPDFHLGPWKNYAISNV